MAENFGNGFLWGAATSSYQIEGGQDMDDRGVSIWDQFCKVPGKVLRGHTGEIACDHRNQYREDVELMAEIGLQAYRFSIAWPRVLPEGTGRVSTEGLGFYDRLVDALMERGIEPWVTLFHWDLPWALHLKGGWLNPDMPQWFEDYTGIVAAKLGDRVQNWMTINEPQVIIGMGHGNGVFAPGLKLSLTELCVASKNLLLAHGRSVRKLRDVCGDRAKTGWAPCGVIAMPATETEADIEAARQATFDVKAPQLTHHDPESMFACMWNSSWWMDPVYLGEYPKSALERFGSFLPKDFEEGLDVIHQPCDFCAFNTYFAEYAAADGNGGFRMVHPSVNMESNTMGWDINPESLYWGARFYHERYGLPVYITENGVPQTDLVEDSCIHDPGRIAFIRAYLSGVARGVKEGVPIKGYFYWSLMDNFEWASGYKQRFGLIHVDYETRKRSLKDSARWYAGVIAKNGLP